MTQEKTLSHDFAQMTFEQGMNELEKLVSQLESPGIGLEDSVKVYERGQALHQHLAKILKQTEMRIEKIGRGTGDSAHAPESEQTASDADSLPF